MIEDRKNVVKQVMSDAEVHEAMRFAKRAGHQDQERVLAEAVMKS